MNHSTKKAESINKKIPGETTYLITKLRITIRRKKYYGNSVGTFLFFYVSWLRRLVKVPKHPTLTAPSPRCPVAACAKRFKLFMNQQMRKHLVQAHPAHPDCVQGQTTRPHWTHSNPFNPYILYMETLGAGPYRPSRLYSGTDNTATLNPFQPV